MFGPDFYPTPDEVIIKMLQGYEVSGKTILEPSAGKGNIVEYLKREGAEVIACENEPNLLKILTGKCKILRGDFLKVTREDISHINAIVMNPPFSNGVRHVLHAYEIAPAGCRIISLINASNLKNDYSAERKQLITLIENHGRQQDLGDCFKQAERTTAVEVAMIVLQKPAADYESEFEGFFSEDEDEESQANGIMPYNAVRDLVNRYVAAVKLYDEQLNTGVKMHSLLNGFYGKDLAFSCTQNGIPMLRNDFKNSLQHAGWKFIFDKLNLHEHITRGVREDINKFIEQNKKYPFTMTNIYKMIEVIIATRGQTMDKALLEVFDKLTMHHDDNRYNVEGWKTNSHFLVNRRFILPGMCYQDQRWHKGESKIQTSYGNNFDLMEDLVKALCYITKDNYKKLGSLSNWIRYPYKVVTNDEVTYHDGQYNFSGAQDRKDKLYGQGIQAEIIHSEPIYGEWFEWAYFRVKAFKKGTMHFEFIDEDLWGTFNQRIAKLKGFPLYEYKKQNKYQDKKTGRAEAETHKAQPITVTPNTAQQQQVMEMIEEEDNF